MKFSLKPTDPTKLDVDLLIIFCEEKHPIPLKGINHELSSLITTATQKEEFEGKEGQFLTLSTKGYIGAYKLLLAGAGVEDKLDYTDLQTLIARSVGRALENKLVKVALSIPEVWLEKFSTQSVISVIVEAVSLASYRFTKYKSEEEKKKIRPLSEVILIVPPARLRGGEEGIRLGIIFAEATLFARDLVNEPAQVTTPSYLASVALDMAQSSKGKVKVTIFERHEAAKLGMHAFLGVAKGSDEPPKFIRLQYRPQRPEKKIVLIGKGITFDTGGLSLKSPEHMETMKLDMAGAASVLAVFKMIGALLPRVELIGLIPACENMPSGKALRPGDILTAMNGKTIEVLNTDAEGRLTLADALSYAVLKEKPDEIIDLATLTGACMVALGEDIAGLWGNNEGLLIRIEKSAAATGEKIWRMPLEKSYKDLIKSTIGDIKNTQTGRFGGAITAALFLHEFVEKVPWVHLDIAGPSFAEKDQPLTPRGGSGFGVRLLLSYLASVA